MVLSYSPLQKVRSWMLLVTSEYASDVIPEIYRTETWEM